MLYPVWDTPDHASNQFLLHRGGGLTTAMASNVNHTLPTLSKAGNDFTPSSVDVLNITRHNCMTGTTAKSDILMLCRTIYVTSDGMELGLVVNM